MCHGQRHFPRAACNLGEPMSRWFSIAPKRLYSVTTKHRVCLRDSKTAAQVAEAFVPAGTKDKVVIEAFPGMARFCLQMR